LKLLFTYTIIYLWWSSKKVNSVIANSNYSLRIWEELQIDCRPNCEILDWHRINYESRISNYACSKHHSKRWRAEGFGCPPSKKIVHTNFSENICLTTFFSHFSKILPNFHIFSQITSQFLLISTFSTFASKYLSVDALPILD